MSKKTWTALLVTALAFSGCASVPSEELNRQAEHEARQLLVVEDSPAREAQKPLVLAHYMPWYQAPKTSKSYGWHWHMGYYDPYEKDANGKTPIATHYYPLTGPYDSADPALIEYQLTLMKLSGIDGVIIDWYGIDDALDYKKIHESSKVLFAAIKKAGMKFAVCYEDQSMGKMILAKKFDYEASVERGKATLKWMDENWFRDEAYVKVDGRPLLLDFGPQHFLKAEQWDQLFSMVQTRPYFVSLNDHMEFYADNFYPWPPMYLSGGKEVTLSQVAAYFTDFYAKTADKTHLVTTVFPGFHDIYEDAQVASSYGYLDDHGGATFRVLLDAALKSKPDIIQIATWNDYGEGTIVEPNEVRGYQQLEELQRAAKSLDPAFPYTADDLRIPLEIFHLRQTKAPPVGLDRVAAAVFAGDAEGFRAAALAVGATPQKKKE
jgi:hypothetical protein